MSIEIRKKEKFLQQEQWAYLSTHPLKQLTSFCYDDDDDEDYTSAITPDKPVLSTEEPDNSPSMGDEHLDTIPATESDEFIKSGVENLISIPSESEGIPEHMCDVPSHDNSPSLDVSKDQIEDFSESNEEFSSIDDDSFSIDKIDYVEASPPDSELVRSEVIDIVIPEVGGIDDDILLTIKDDILREKLLNVNLLISKIEALNSFKDFFDSNDDSTSIDDDSFSIDDIDYVEASPPHSELISLEEMKDFDPKDRELEDDVLREKLSKINLLISKIKTLNANPTPSSDFVLKSPSSFPNSFLEETDTFDNSLPESKIFCFDIKEKNSGSTTIHADISLSDLDYFYFKSEPDPGDLTSIIDFRIHENVPSATYMNLSPEDDQYPLFSYVVWIFFLFSRILLLLHIFSPPGMKIPFLTPASLFIILLCRVYLIRVELL
nr:hypothetical protein [Tanacetum cinerariifolium]